MLHSEELRLRHPDGGAGHAVPRFRAVLTPRRQRGRVPAATAVVPAAFRNGSPEHAVGQVVTRRMNGRRPGRVDRAQRRAAPPWLSGASGRQVEPPSWAGALHLMRSNSARSSSRLEATSCSASRRGGRRRGGAAGRRAGAIRAWARGPVRASLRPRGRFRRRRRDRRPWPAGRRCKGRPVHPRMRQQRRAKAGPSRATRPSVPSPSDQFISRRVTRL